MERICVTCGKTFVVKGGTRKECDDCFSKRNTAFCVVCGKPFIRQGTKFCCSRECAIKSSKSKQTGRSRTQESINKQRNSILHTIKNMSIDKRAEWINKIKEACNTTEYKEIASKRSKNFFDNMSVEERIIFGNKISAVCGIGTDANERRRQKCIKNQKEYSEEKLKVFYNAGVKGAKASGNRFRTYGVSKIENELACWIGSLGVVFDRNNREVLGGKEIDFFFPEFKFGIEFNGNYYHSVQGILKLDAKYPTFNLACMKHQEKSLLALERGIRLIHIWQWEWEDVRIRERLKSEVLGALGMSNRIFARNCVLRELGKEESKQFFEQNSEFGNKNTLFSYGLFNVDKLVMAFGVGYKQNGRGVDVTKFEICRSATVLNTVVVGGSSKLLKAVKERIKSDFPLIKELHYFVDFDKHTGSSLKAMGFEFLGHTPPTLRIMFHSNVILRGKVFEKNKIYSRQGSLHKEIKLENDNGNLSTYANAGTLHFKMNL